MWIARDKDGGLYLFEKMPVSFDNVVFSKTSGYWNRLPGNLFPELTFTNSPKRVSLIIDYRDCFDAGKFVDNETTPVETVDGKKVTIYSTERENLYSVVGEINECCQLEAWTSEGKFEGKFKDDIDEHKYNLMFCEKR